ncbi:Hypothetical predicted protein [Scomber scombrus]|uniref:Yippee domain-containing protein n=1 Tax=Scomber scombrus TaxID=13677 RepID=A0AAV1PFL4_SCOSC
MSVDYISYCITEAEDELGSQSSLVSSSIMCIRAFKWLITRLTCKSSWISTGATFHKAADDDDKRLWLKQRRTVTENQHAASGFICRQQDVKHQTFGICTRKNGSKNSQVENVPEASMKWKGTTQIAQCDETDVAVFKETVDITIITNNDTERQNKRATRTLHCQKCRFRLGYIKGASVSNENLNLSLKPSTRSSTKPVVEMEESVLKSYTWTMSVLDCGPCVHDIKSSKSDRYTFA